MKCILLNFIFFVWAGILFAQEPLKNQIELFTSRTGAIPGIGKATGSVSMLKFPAGKAMKISGAGPQEKALSFLQQNKDLFGIKPGKSDFVLKESKKDNYGLDHVILEQYFQGVPIYDGVVKFHFNKSNDITSMNGNVVAVGELNTVASVSRADAAGEAIRIVTAQKTGKLKVPLKIKSNTLYVFQKGLVQGYRGPKHLVYEVEVSNDRNVREFVFIDAHSKAVVEQFDGISYLHRRLYEEEYINGQKIYEEGDSLPGTLQPWHEKQIKVTGHIYNLMKNAFGYVSFNNKDSAMIIVNDDIYSEPDLEGLSPRWNGTYVSSFSSTATDDVIAHEWAHAYTQSTSGLVNAGEAGALNEAYSDIWGETVDLMNGYLDSDENNAVRTGCASSTRWLIGEKITGRADPILRDMWDPTCKHYPGKVSDPQYTCNNEDYYYNFPNMGILNHAYALLVDGGTYNGQIITGIGLTKAAHIFWRAQSSYMTRTTGFVAMADILELSVNDLIGINLPRLYTYASAPVLSGQVITTADAEQLSKVIAAVEMGTDNGCFTLQTLHPVSTPLCAGGSAENAFFYEDFESGLNGWSLANSGEEENWTAHNWEIASKTPGAKTDKVAYGTDRNVGSGLISMTSPAITIPTGSAGPYNLAFDHYVTLGYRNGGNIKCSINDGAWILIPDSAFTENPYNRRLIGYDDEFSPNPLNGERAFSGSFYEVASWEQSRINLSLLGLKAGQTIRFRWDLGTKIYEGLEGWYIDNIRVYTCSIPSVQFVADASIVREGDADQMSNAPDQCLNYTEKRITIRINKAPPAPVRVTLKTPAGSATLGNKADYTISPGSFVFEGEKISQDIIVRVYDDALVEENETILLAYSLESNSIAVPETYNQRHVLTIMDDDFVPDDANKQLLFADFNNGLPPGWQIPGRERALYDWNLITNLSRPLDPSGPPLLMASSENQDPDFSILPVDAIVESAPFSTVGRTNIVLSFIQEFQRSGQQGLVDVWDGSEWHSLLVQNASSGPKDIPRMRYISIPQEYANHAMKVRFRYIADNDYSWSIDNVKVTGDISAQIETALTSTPDAQYLGPNATVYFYDPGSRDLIAKIKNLGDHDYGCTTVAIDRAGVDETDWIGSYHITKKTFKVIPANNNPAGQYEITLYYKASELPNFNGTDIKSMGKSEGSIKAGDASTSSLAPVVGSNVFGSDYAYTATFDSGFSGFGLSDLPASGPASRMLPVTQSKADDGQSSNLKLYPNPVQSLVKMEVPDEGIKSVNVQVISLSGKQVLTKRNLKRQYGSFNLDLGGLSPGIYQVILSGEKRNYTFSALKL
ncbi:M4 family metallopeptidase [Dyadobacter sp. NIV53]|uniref:M4 family metallopeptidase n=1 Tax=Dyadobacter sp. NIV53 TaxID=2861765 RepID=UPI001C87889E|nr:M4 family metallopeptidase [Dyadobacter sp. NIV53]